jgi:hypothetical protein
VEDSLDYDGRPIITVTVGWSKADADAARKAGKSPPTALTVEAFIDTGSNVTCIDRSLVASLALSPLPGGTVPVTSSSGTTNACRYHVSLGVLNWQSDQLLVLDADCPKTMTTPRPKSFSPGAPDFHVFLGRDVLKHGEFVYAGPAHKFRLTFP